MKRVLVISYYWPPSGGSGVQRWVKFARYLPEEGWQPVIYTPSNPELIATDSTLADEIPEEVEIVRTRIFEPYAIYRKLSGTEKTRRESQVNPINSGKKSMKEQLALAIRGNLFIPDPRCLWIRPSVTYLKKYLKEHPVDIIVSTGPPHSMHLIAWKLSKATSTPWIADFRDPWTKMFYFKHLGLCHLAEAKHRRQEKKVLDNASAIVSVSPLVRDEFKEMTDTPVHLITNGFDPEDFSSSPENDGYFNITHTGLFAEDGNPENLWEILARMAGRDPEFADRLRIRIVGKTDTAVIDNIRTAGLERNLVDRGYQTHREAVKEQQKASVLLLPLRKEPEYRAVLPGKLFEYLAARKPLLGIGQTDGAMAAIVNEVGCGITADWEETEKMASFIDDCWNAFREGREIYAGKDISRFSRRNLTKDYANLMNQLTK